MSKEEGPGSSSWPASFNPTQPVTNFTNIPQGNSLLYYIYSFILLFFIMMNLLTFLNLNLNLN